MDKQCFVLEFPHSMEGQGQRIIVSYKFLVIACSVVVFLSLSSFVLVSSYLRMSWKVSNYNELSDNFDRLRQRYQELQRISRQHNEQIASLETLASEMTVAYGINQPATVVGPSPIVTAASLSPNIKDSIAEYNYLRAASFGGQYSKSVFRWQTHSQPSLWPVTGVLRSSFGGRSDPFSGEGSFHTGIDISTPQGSEVHATADGVVASAGWAGGYGRLLVIDHGNGLQTYYAHLSRLLVIPGQAVRSNEVVALSGSSGRSTGPHIHYEVRLAGTPVNPYKYLAKPHQIASIAAHPTSDLGL